MDGNKKRIKKEPETTFLIGSKRSQGLNLTNACNIDLQATPFKNYGSGLPKEAHIDISNFRANEKGVVLGNLHGVLPIF